MTDAWRPHAAAWWASPAWHAYEVANGEVPGARTALLATATWQTRLLDLALDPPALRRGMRKGRRAEITAAAKRWTIRADAAMATIEAYIAVHQTAFPGARPAATYAHQLAWGDSGWDDGGHGLAAVALDPGGAPGAAVYVIRHGIWAYYASGPSRVPNTLAAVLWAAILACRAAGVRWFELGWQGHATDAKGQAIEAFKRHFGGVDVSARLTPHPNGG